MRRLLLLFVLWALPSAAADIPSPAQVGVRLEKPAGDGTHFSQGSGVYLGNGLVLTAAHVVTVDPENPKVTVVVDGWRRDAVVIKNGHKDNLDLALIRVLPQGLSEQRKAQPQVAICDSNPTPSQPVIVAAMGNVSDAATISTPITSDGQAGTWTNLLSSGFHHGNSGGGVFNPKQGCLWGIINIELSGNVGGRFLDLTAFVPATKIAPFLGEYYGEGR